MKSRPVHDRLASLFEGRTLQGYIRWKVRSDPAYRGVAAALQGYEQPLLDLGCGIGLLAFYLREQGYAAPILGIDFDQRKIDVARKAATRYRGLDFIAGDARDPLPSQHNVVIVDILHYFDAESQRRILENAARACPAGGVVVIRQGLRDGSWRYRLTAIVDAIGRGIRWMKAESLSYPSREEVTAAFAGYEVEVTPLRGRTPYNNYLFVFRRPATASRPE